jgi:hypothetical protein
MERPTLLQVAQGLSRRSMVLTLFKEPRPRHGLPPKDHRLPWIERLQRSFEQGAA